jgi:hypothetical protein
VVAQVRFGDDERVFDGRACARGEQSVEAAIERDARDNRDENRRYGGNDRKQSNDPDMQSRGGATAASRLYDLPYLAQDDAQQQQHRHRVHKQQGYDHVVRG